MINFHDEKNKNSYTTRMADPTWTQAIEEITSISGKEILDVGGGGGIYSIALANLGAKSVICMDYSAQMVDAARENTTMYPQIKVIQGDALEIQFEENSVDIIIERALIHHLNDLDTCFTQAFRVLRPGGTFIVQDRTPEDCLVKGSETHIRGYFFSCFPQLIGKEISRRHRSETVIDALSSAGFDSIEVQSLWETRRIYAHFKELEHDLLKRTGRSILHEITDEELLELIAFMQDRIETDQQIIEKDRWTVWLAKKPL